MKIAQSATPARELLFLQPTGQLDELVPQIRAAGWNVHIARNTSQAKAFIDRHSIDVGLAEIDDRTAPGRRCSNCGR